MHADLMEPRLRIEADGMTVGRVDQQPDAAATNNKMEADHDLRHREATVAAALLVAIERKPAQPPTGIVAPIRVQHVEPDQRTIRFDADHCMGQTIPNG
jgi:hypothetical protein